MKASTKEIKISEILHLAADKYLTPVLGDFFKFGDIYQYAYSCWAVEEAAHEYTDYNFEAFENVVDCIKIGLESMGCNTASAYMFVDSKYPQGDRYMWLKFAAIIAEEQEAAGYKFEI